MTTIATRIDNIKQLINTAAASCHRLPDAIRLVAVSKGQSTSSIFAAYQAGITDIGENYLQEAQIKMRSLQDLPINWHFIGPIQSNKTQAIAENFQWVHSVSRAKIAELLAKHRPPQYPALNVCIQVNLDNETNKSGIPPAELNDLARLIIQLPRLNLRGLMAIPQPLQDEQQQYESFLRLTQLLKGLNQELAGYKQHYSLSESSNNSTAESPVLTPLDTLSMGMSNDLTAAIHAGSTLVRVGKAIFGERV